uniref:Secreted protein n=1 Tax=Ixodes scapularis TaxID=6945 RepID=A0A4D5RCA9_IXOSC
MTHTVLHVSHLFLPVSSSLADFIYFPRQEPISPPKGVTRKNLYKFFLHPFNLSDTFPLYLHVFEAVSK